LSQGYEPNATSSSDAKGSRESYEKNVDKRVRDYAEEEDERSKKVRFEEEERKRRVSEENEGAKRARVQVEEEEEEEQIGIKRKDGDEEDEEGGGVKKMRIQQLEVINEWVLDIEQVVNSELEEEKEEEMAWDDVKGIWIPAGLVRESRQEEVTYMVDRALWEERSVEECWRVTGKAPVSLKWVDTDKGALPVTLQHSSTDLSSHKALSTM
jgi:hypothetical protein